MRVGVVGSGEAARLAAALAASVNRPLEVRCHDARAEPAAQLASSSAVIVSIFGREDEAAAALLGDDGVLQGAHGGLTVIELSPTSPGFMGEVAARFSAVGARAYGAVLDGTRAYVDDDLSRDPDALALVQAVAPRIRATGAIGTSKSLAIIERLMACVTATVAAEAVAIGSRAGISSATLVALLLKGSGGNEALRALPASGPRGTLDDFQHDLELAQRLGREVGHSVVFGALALAACRGAMGAGDRSSPAYHSVLRWFGATPADAREMRAVTA